MGRREQRSDTDVETAIRGGTAEFWAYFRVGMLAPLLSILWQVTVRRKRYTKASLGGTQCGSAASLLLMGAIASVVLLYTLTPSIPHGVAVIPIALCGTCSPVLLFFGTFTYLKLHGRHRRSNLHIILSVAAAVISLCVIIWVVLYSLLSGMWTAM